jgi:murein DD-endopeptidase MepM/ murein hydrolase activator NlpD
VVRHRVRTLAVLLTLVLVATVAGAAADDLQDRYDRTQDQLAEAEEHLGAVTEQVGTAQQQLAAADQQLIALEAELQARERELAAARTAYDESRARTAAATRELQAITERLERTRQDLTEREQRFDARIASAYKYGNVGYASALMGAEDVEDFVNTMYYVRSVMRTDRTLIDGVAETARQIADDRLAADALREQLARDEAEAAQLKADVERATSTQRRLTEMVAAERTKRSQLLTQLRSTREDYEALVDELATESKQLAEEIRASQYAGRQPGKGGLLWPTNGRRTSGYGWRTHPIYGSRRMHAGIDIGGGIGQPIIAAAAGKVISAGWRGGYGLTVVVDHGGGMATLYAHQSRLSVSPGMVVDQGAKIGEVGSTGNSTGPHLHFEVRVDGEPRDPMGWY